jgi:TPR repeat protein
MRFVGVFVIFAAMLLNGCISSQTKFADGIRCFQVQDYRQAFIRLIPLAEAGNHDAQYAVGYMYYYGQGVLEDRKKAWHWIKCAAKAGQSDALIAVKMLTRSDMY